MLTCLPSGSWHRCTRHRAPTRHCSACQVVPGWGLVPRTCRQRAATPDQAPTPCTKHVLRAWGQLAVGLHKEHLPTSRMPSSPAACRGHPHCAAETPDSGCCRVEQSKPGHKPPHTPETSSAAPLAGTCRPPARARSAQIALLLQARQLWQAASENTQHPTCCTTLTTHWPASAAAGCVSPTCTAGGSAAVAGSI